MSKVLTMLHTTPVVIKLLGDVAQELVPADVIIRTVVDDSLLNDVRKAGHLTKEVTRRIVGYAQHAENYGSDCLLLTCSSVGPAADVARQVVNIPLLKIDEPMAERAVSIGCRISVLATLGTTLPPTRDLIQQAAQRARKQVDIGTVLLSDAFEALSRGDVTSHNRLLKESIIREAETSDVVVLAQASMTNILPDLPRSLDDKVLTSPRLGFSRVRELLSSL